MRAAEGYHGGKLPGFFLPQLLHPRSHVSLQKGHSLVEKTKSHTWEKSQKKDERDSASQNVKEEPAPQLAPALLERFEGLRPASTSQVPVRQGLDKIGYTREIIAKCWVGKQA